MEEKNCESGRCSLEKEKVEFIKIANPDKSLTAKKLESGIKIKIFGKKDCSICKVTMEKLSVYISNMTNRPSTIYYDLDTLDGLSEAASYTAFDVPTIIIEKDGVEIKRWKTLPAEEEMKSVCS
jgi:hypothetical protein